MWSINDSASLYNIQGWGEPYFAINAAGNVTVAPQGEKSVVLDIPEIIKVLQQQGLNLPMLICFPEILVDRLQRLHKCMNEAIARYDYQGYYHGVFPIKCNHSPQLIKTLVQAPLQQGLEAGSKAELAITLAAMTELSTKEAIPLLMCNGHKDRDYVTMALLATRLGQHPLLIIEQRSELELILEVSQELGIEPLLGVRIKLSTHGIGRWRDTTGERGKFGLTVGEILQVLQHLNKLGKLASLQLLHFHIGSQISAIGVIKDAIREASQVYVQLRQLGAPMGYLNVGGGLAVDYDGSKSNSPASKNYNMQNYANDIVAQVKDACDQAGVEHPVLISESGRAIAAHQGVLVFEVLDNSEVACPAIMAPGCAAPLVLKNFWETYQGIELNNLQESYHDAIQFKQEALSLFNLGYLNLEERAQAEALYQACFNKIMSMVGHAEPNPAISEELSNLEQTLAVTYYINMSIFRSLPDAWAINQLFPIMPLQRLAEQPYIKGILADITCDSDGKIDRFISRQGSKPLLELHSLSVGQPSPYYLGAFLVGAYQEILGNFHNLFGKINTAYLETNDNGWKILAIDQSHRIKDVLASLQFELDHLPTAISDRLALQDNRLNSTEAQKIRDFYMHILNSSTYLS